MLHRVRLWREYMIDPNAGLKSIIQAAGLKTQYAKGAAKYLERLKRDFAVSQSIAGIKPHPTDPLAPDDIQIFTVEEQ